MGLAIVSLIVLVLLGALAGLILTRVFGAAAPRNQKRPEGGEDKGGRDLMGDNAQAKKARGRMRRSLGWALAAFGILLAAVGAASSFDEMFMNDAVPLAFLGTVPVVAGLHVWRPQDRGLGGRLLGSSPDLFGRGKPGDTPRRRADGPQPTRERAERPEAQWC